MFKNSTLNNKKKEVDVTKNGKNFLDPSVQSPSVPAFGVQASRGQASSHPKSKRPGVQRPNVQTMRPESSFSGMPF